MSPTPIMEWLHDVDGLDPVHDALEPLAHARARMTPLVAQEADDGLEVVLHPVPQFLQQNLSLGQFPGVHGSTDQDLLIGFVAAQRHAEARAIFEALADMYNVTPGRWAVALRFGWVPKQASEVATADDWLQANYWDDTRLVGQVKAALGD